MKVRAIVLMAGMMLAGPMFGQANGSGVQDAKAQAAVHGTAEMPRLRLVFTVKELDNAGKVLNTREYQTMIAAQTVEGKSSRAEIRSGAKVPVPSGSNSGPNATTQFTYIDVGVNFDVGSMVWLSANRIAMTVAADISSFEPGIEGNPHPLIRNNKWSSDEQMSVGEQKALFSSDDPGSKNRLQVSLAVQRAD